MGACYVVECELKIKEGMENKVIETIQNKIKRAEEENVDYGINNIPQTLEGLFEIFFVEHQKNYDCSFEDGWYVISSGFNVSYGWARVMYEMFENISPYLEHKSQLYIDIDEGWDKFRLLKNGTIMHTTSPD